jgi:hypothetical protein
LNSDGCHKHKTPAKDPILWGNAWPLLPLLKTACSDCQSTIGEDVRGEKIFLIFNNMVRTNSMC